MTKLFYILGIWPKQKASIYYWIYGIVMMLIFTVLLTMSMIIQLIGFTELSNLTESMFLTLTEFALMTKVLNLYIHLRSIQQLLRSVEEFRLETVAEREYFNKRLKLIFVLLMIDFSITNLAHALAIMKVLLDSNRNLTFPLWCPFDWKNNSQNYWLVFTYELFAIGITSNTHVAIQWYTTFIFCMISTKTEILSMRLQNIGYSFDDETKSVDTEVKRIEIKKSFKDCIALHHRILRYGVFSVLVRKKFCSTFLFSDLPIKLNVISQCHCSFKSVLAAPLFAA